MKMSNTRLNKCVHVWTLDKSASGIRNWAHDVKYFYISINMDSSVNIDNNVNVKVVLNNMNDVLHMFCFVLLISLMCIANAKAYDGFAHFIHNIYSTIE